MKSAPLPANEKERLEALLRFEVLDSEDERAFDELTQLAGEICGSPISLISLIDGERQWFKSRIGLGVTETPRELAFCAHAIHQDQLFEVPNALEDERFADNPLVTGAPDIRFYAGAPLLTQDGLALGTLCVIDRQPRKLNDLQRRALQTLARQVVSQLELRLHARRLERIDETRGKVFATIAHDLRSPFNGILGLTRILKDNANALSASLIQKSAASLYENASNAYQLLDEMLQWYQQETGGVPRAREASCLSELVNEALPLLRQLAESKGLALHVEVPAELCVLADPAVLKTVVRNLVSNAIKYSPSGGLVQLKAVAVGGQVRVSVSDQGTGVSTEKRSQLFEGTVESKVGTSGEEGTGFGLKLCADFLRAQQGRIWLDEEYTEGTRICFELAQA